MRVKSVFRKASDERLIRLFRLMWIRGTVGDGKGYSAMLSFGLSPRLIAFQKGWHEFRVWLLGVRIHYQRSYGGIHA